MNGVLNLSTLDGWWAEACQHGENGWQYGDGKQMKSVSRQDSHDARCLMRVLNEEVIPTYYENRLKWMRMMRNSILGAKDTYSAETMVKDYYRRLY